MKRKQSFSLLYFEASCNYILMKFLMQDEVLKHARVANTAKRVDMTYSSVAYFVNRFHDIVEIEHDELEMGFAHYPVDSLDGVMQDEGADSVWTQISSLKDK